MKCIYRFYQNLDSFIYNIHPISINILISLVLQMLPDEIEAKFWKYIGGGELKWRYERTRKNSLVQGSRHPIVLPLSTDAVSFQRLFFKCSFGQRWHPDRCSALGNSMYVEEAKKKFQAIQEAYSGNLTVL